jgi:hypothetical protein
MPHGLTRAMGPVDTGYMLHGRHALGGLAAIVLLAVALSGCGGGHATHAKPYFKCDVEGASPTKADVEWCMEILRPLYPYGESELVRETHGRWKGVFSDDVPHPDLCIWLQTQGHDLVTLNSPPWRSTKKLPCH